MPDVMTSPAFDLETAILDWRSRLCDHQYCQSADAAELETHLRDAIDRLCSLGLSPDEAFFISAKRLGDPAALSLEFTKVDQLLPWRIQLIWMAAGYVFAVLLNGIVRITAAVGIELAIKAGLPAIAWISMLGIECLVPFAIIFMLFRSAMPSRNPPQAAHAATWVYRLWKSFEARPALSFVMTFAVIILSLLIIPGLGISANWQNIPQVVRHQMFIAMSITTFAWYLVMPAFVMFLVLRCRRAFSRSA